MVSLLGQDAENCYYGLHEFQDLTNTEIPTTFKRIYGYFETVPVLFLSLSRDIDGEINGLYLWQINQLCPSNFGRDIIEIDVYPKDMDKGKLCQHASLLLLLKIIPEDGERFLEAKFMSNHKVLLKLVIEDSQIELRTYNLADCYANAIVNPYKTIGRRIHEFASKLLIQRTEMEEQSDWSLTLYRPKRPDELELYPQEAKSEALQEIHDGILRNKAIESRVLEGSSSLSIDQLLTEVLFHTEKENIIIIDRLAAHIIKFSSEGLHVFSLEKLGCIVSAKIVDNSLYIISKEQHITEIYLSGPIDIDNFKARATLPAGTILSGTHDNWQIVRLTKSNSSAMVEHIIYYKENKFYSLPLDGCGQDVQMLTKAKDNDDTSSGLTWDLVIQNENPEMVFNKRTVYLVYVVEDDFCIYDMLTSRKVYIKQAVDQKQGSRRNTKLICVTHMAAYVYLEGEIVLADCIVKLQHSSGFATMLLDTEAKMTCTTLVSGYLAQKPSFGSRPIQIEGFESQIILARFSGGPYYDDQTHMMPFGKHTLSNTSKLKEQQPVQTPDTQQEESKDSALERVARRINAIKQNLLSQDPKQSEIEKYNEALNEVRKEIGPVVSKLFKESQERVTFARKKVKENEEMYLWQRNRYQRPKPTITSRPNDNGSCISETVLEEYIKAYKDIKEAKKKTVKKRENEKAKDKV